MTENTPSAGTAPDLLTGEDGTPFPDDVQRAHELAVQVVISDLIVAQLRDEERIAAEAEQRATDRAVGLLIERGRIATRSWVTNQGLQIGTALVCSAHDLGCGCEDSTTTHLQEWARAYGDAHESGEAGHSPGPS